MSNPAEQNRSTLESSCEIVATRECTKTKKETATDINTAGSKVEQDFLKSRVEDIAKARQLIENLSEEFDGLILLTEETGGYQLAKNEFELNYLNTTYKVDQGMVVKLDPDTGSFTIRNGCIAGKSLFTKAEFEDLLETQVAYLQNEETKVQCASNMEGVSCRDKKVTIEFTKQPKPVEQIREVVNNYNVLMIMPGMDNHECCFQNIITPNRQPAPNVIRYNNGCYHGHMIHGNQRIDYNFPEHEFRPFLESCGGQLDLNTLTANQFATCTDIPQPLCNFREQYPQYVTQAPNCGWNLAANQYAICNSYAPSNYSQESHQYETMCFGNDVFPIAEYHPTTNTHSVVIGGEVSHFQEPEMVEFLTEYNADCLADIKDCDVDRGPRYTKQYVDKKYENKAYKKFLRAERTQQKADSAYKDLYDDLNVNHQTLIDQYDNLLAACKNPEDKAVRKAKKKIEQHQEKMTKELGKAKEKHHKQMERVKKYRAKACDIAEEGVNDLAKDRAKHQDEFQKDLDKKQGVKKDKKNQTTNE